MFIRPNAVRQEMPTPAPTRGAAEAEIWQLEVTDWLVPVTVTPPIVAVPFTV
jgi:hypothetical protein